MSCEWMSRLQQHDKSPPNLFDPAFGFHNSGDEIGSIFQLKGTGEMLLVSPYLSSLSLYRLGCPSFSILYLVSLAPSLWSIGMMDHCIHQGEREKEKTRGGWWRGIYRIRRAKGKMERGMGGHQIYSRLYRGDMLYCDSITWQCI